MREPAVDRDRAMRRDHFAIPQGADGNDIVYMAGNSLGLMPLAARAVVDRVLDEWSTRAVDGHFHGDAPWYCSEEPIEAQLANVVGARPHEVAIANALTVNLHLLLASLHQPRPGRRAVVIEEGAFPSDRYAVETHLARLGDDPRDTIVELERDPDTRFFEPDSLTRLLEARPDVATVVLGGVHYLTGEVLDMAAMTKVAHDAGCTVILDLAHAAGNVVLDVHDWGVDGAVLCSYKYLNGGPGATGALFVHERHGANVELVRLGGWWGNDPDRRFAMDANPSFVPRPGAAGWKISNPSPFGFVPLGVSLDLFAEVGMAALRERSLWLTGALADHLENADLQVMSPRDQAQRGCQVSVRVSNAERVLRAMADLGVVADVRPPDVIRLAPTPLYSTFEDVDHAAASLLAAIRRTG